ncbi:unnamed protein product [Heterotrigona itama]|uniref:PiggyBac transposable element-derived protein domain-containing protein n=1 Tax=Heterotrigona itama TaxID=395501 RepID=A0A6V7H156_9HYME|nr:unnamed protein product [Heterotrigona itama]
MCSSFKEFVTRDDSDLDQTSDLSEDYNGGNAGNVVPLISDSEDRENSINDRIDNFKPIIHALNDQNSGIKGNLTPESTPLDAFQLFFSEQLVSHITEETNNYFKFVIENTTSKTHSRTNSWKYAHISICEMYGFLVIIMSMPRMKKLTLNEY